MASTLHFWHRIKLPEVASAESISVSGAGLGDVDTCAELGRTIGGSTRLKRLEIKWAISEREEPWGDPWHSFEQAEAEPRAECVASFLRGLANNRSVEELILRENFEWYFREGALQLLAPFFEFNHRLKLLRVWDYRPENGLTDTSFDLISSILATCQNLEIVEIELAKAATVSNESIAKTVRALGALPKLQKIVFTGGHRIDPMHVEIASAFFSIIQNPETMVNEIDLSWKLNDDWLVSFARCLKFNRVLKKITGIKEHSFSARGWKPLKHTLRHFNDTFQTFDARGIYGTRNLLDMNKKQYDTKSIRLRKDLDFSFLLPERGFNEEPFGADFDVRLLPYVLSSIGITRNEDDKRSKKYRLSALFYFVQSMPLLVTQKGQTLDETQPSLKRYLSVAAGFVKRRCLEWYGRK